MDISILLAFNGAHTPALDKLMWWFSLPTNALWLTIYVLLIIAIVWLYRGQNLTDYSKGNSFRSWLPLIGALVAIALAVGLADYISSGILKPWVGRLRPTHEPALNGMLHIVNNYRGGLYGFPSSHAANTMAVTLIVWLLCGVHRYRSVGRTTMRPFINGAGIALLIIYVLPNCISRIYLGVHYPSDVIVGLLIGALTALFAFGLFRLLLRKILIH